ncbi:hypothetical protein MKW92_005333 [Papaver armeniacum]|nr:hypothetical protein MKW92_005333 [Papaver armeniacum]
MNPPIALVVDDSEFMRKFHKAVRLHEEGKRFDVMLMDYEMPEMNGAQATSRIREMGVQSVILGVSGIDDETVQASFVQSGLTEFFSKPLRRHIVDGGFSFKVKFVSNQKNHALTSCKR